MRFPLPPSLSTPASRGALAWTALRVLLAGLIAAYGWARVLAGGIAPFGTFLESQGLPFGFAWAVLVTFLEILGSILLLLGRLVAPVCLVFASIYAVGIALVHVKAGWFVVGLGRNGSEYSVLLIACLLAVGLQHIKARSEA